MRAWDAERIARATGARLAGPVPVRPDGESGPARAIVDSREAGPGDLFVGLPGASQDGGRFAASALAAGAWGVLVEPAHAEAARCAPPGVLLAHERPLAGLQQLARAWRRSLGARVVAVTGSTGKTSTKDILAALLGGHLRTVASRQNYNTEIGLPLAILEAPAGSQALVLELAMRGPGQIGELTAIAEPDVGVIVNIGPVHLERLGSLEAIAAAKAELIAGLAAGSTAVVPSREPLLEKHLRADLLTLTFGDGGAVRIDAVSPGAVVVEHEGERMELRPSFSQAHNQQNLLAAVAAARALGVTPRGPVDVAFSALRGERVALPGGVILINDCYNANPMSMRAALDDLASSAPARRLAVLGDMLELGPQQGRFHREIGAHAAERGIDVLVTVGPLAEAIAAAFPGERHSVADAAAAAELLPGLLREGDTVLVKGSRGVGLERVAEALAEGPAPLSGKR